MSFGNTKIQNYHNLLLGANTLKIPFRRTASGETEQAASKAPQEQASNQGSKEMLSAREPSAASDTKSSWRSAGGKSKRPSKDFFTPKDESGEPDVETEKVYKDDLQQAFVYQCFPAIKFTR